MDKTAILRALADNPALMEAVRETIESEFKTESIDLNMDNEMLGQITRSKIDGLQKIDSAFKKIAQSKSVPDAPEKKNPGR
jgi:hypothetical protein